MKQTQINLYKWEELSEQTQEVALTNYIQKEAKRWTGTNKICDNEDLCKAISKITKSWQSMTGIEIFIGSMIFNIETGVQFLTAIEPNSKILDYYEMQGRFNYENAQRIKNLKYYKRVIKEVSFSVSYTLDDDTPPQAFNLKGYYYPKNKNSRVAKTKEYQQVAEELKAIILATAKRIALDIQQFLLEVRAEQENDEYLIDLFKTQDIWFLSDGRLYNEN